MSINLKSKDLRKQLRNVIQEILPELLTSELMKVLEQKITARLDLIDQRQKDITGYMVRQSAPAPIKK